MATDKTKQNQDQPEEIETVSPVETLDENPQNQQNGKTIEEALSPYIAFLEAMKTTKAHIDTAPTFTPKNFYDQIQFYDDGANRRIYLYINGDWRYVALT